MVETTEYGASAIAILLLRELTDFQYFERMRQDEIGDYMIRQSKEAMLFSFLEISGIWNKNTGNNVTKYFALINSVNFRKWIFSIDFL